MMRRQGTARSRRSVHSLEFKVVPIGNSRGVRLPKGVLDKYAVRDAVIVEEREDWSSLSRPFTAESAALA
jgi:antitoxin component of MazEF toxin-antitoxin module